MLVEIQPPDVGLPQRRIPCTPNKFYAKSRLEDVAKVLK